MAKPERPFPFAGKNILLFRERKKAAGCFFPRLFGIYILNITPGSEGPGTLPGGEICGGGHHPGVGNTEIRPSVAEIGPSPGFGKYPGVFLMTGWELFPRRPVQFPQNAPAFGPRRPGTGMAPGIGMI
jgi:hypothetical protein